MEKNAIKFTKSVNTSDFKFDYLLVIDFECQCVKGEQLKVQEIVEFPVVVVDVKEMKILDEVFHYYIRPTVYPNLFDFFKELTGITQDQVNNGILLEEALEKFVVWLEELGLVKNEERLKNFMVVTDGNSDINKFLKNEAAYKNIKLPKYLCEWFDLREEFYYFTGIKGGIKKQLRYFQIDFEGSKHSGIDDSKNIAKIVVECLKMGCSFNSKRVRTTYKIDKENDLNWYYNYLEKNKTNYAKNYKNYK